jgi:hypothetical protein
MNPDDYAIVVGIRDYPHFGPTNQEPRHLQGPDNDAVAVYDWLTDPAKGGVPKAQATLIRSGLFNPPGAPALQSQPQKQAIINAFDDLENRAQANDLAGNGLRVGRRLYVYMSGHGFAPRRKEGAVFVADATRQRTNHVFASRWLEWFYNAEYFSEFVLWMDCCMTFDLFIIPETAGYRVLQGSGNGRLFTAYAAKFPQQAVERVMPDGQTHGVFTYTLLEGLNGAAADPATRRVTSASLRDFLTLNMKTFMAQIDRDDTSVSKEPDFGFDDDIVFCEVSTVPQATITFSFPPAVQGQNFSVVTGTPPTVVHQGTVNGASLQVPLPAGIYFVKIPGGSRGFEVEGTQGMQVNV